MPVAALLRRLSTLFALCLLLTVAGAPATAQQPDLGRCVKRPAAVLGKISVDIARWCVESVYHDPMLEAMSFSALEIAPDGTLYATLPLSGAVVAIRDRDGDGLPDALESFIEGLTLPMGLAFHDGFLYISGREHIYRAAESGEVEIIVDDLPVGAGFWTGGIAIGEDERLYVAMGAPCDNCEYDERERGAILSMALDGGDRRVFASGFRQPADVAFFRGRLWTLDSAPRQSERNALDELNLVEPGGWHGFPYCLGAGQVNLPSDAVDCAESVLPAMLFGSGAKPVGLAAYLHDALPGAGDTLVVALAGEPSQIDFVGYKVIMISFDEANKPLGATLLIPYRHQAWQQAYLPYRGEGLFWERFIYISEQGFGLYPQQPLALAVHPRGWIYISVTGGRILALRPAHEIPDHAALYPVWTPMHPDFDPSAEPDAFEASQIAQWYVNNRGGD